MHVNSLVGCAEVVTCWQFTRLEPYVVNDRPRCSRCERRVPRLETAKDSCCQNCVTHIMTAVRNVLSRDPDDFPIKEDVEPREPKTLVFLCARKSTDSDLLKADSFDKLLESVRESERWVESGDPSLLFCLDVWIKKCVWVYMHVNESKCCHPWCSKAVRFDQFNRPGLPQEVLVVGKFASAANSRCPLSMMTTPTLKQLDDVLTLNVLLSFIINACRPGDTVLIVISQPASLCIGHQDLVTTNVPFSTLWFFLTLNFVVHLRGGWVDYRSCSSVSSLSGGFRSGPLHLLSWIVIRR
jgi:hypothetical protein